MNERQAKRTERARVALTSAILEVMLASSYLMLNDDARYKELIQVADRLDEIAESIAQEKAAAVSATASSSLPTGARINMSVSISDDALGIASVEEFDKAVSDLLFRIRNETREWQVFS